VVATTGDVDAVQLVREHAPDVVLLDVRMPRIDGLEVLRQLQTLSEPPAVAMLTTKAESAAGLMIRTRRCSSGPERPAGPNSAVMATERSVWSVTRNRSTGLIDRPVGLLAIAESWHEL